ncbi:ADP-dependent glucokinase/phosphofructokinase [Agreia pratensis]|uniref:ADP-dependent phosphofructokinase/glucokinase n=1 Tax=Agreia pratensis TaxID=150121 RepID=A0A1X7JC46_9MICO|nr:ADP-dependent glucokinase/phosphofructokinase [Agreia pratensis]SMG25469.1 ADP-dependent phosphofructokinase/glucokinase [Agreia pratensis]
MNEKLVLGLGGTVDYEIVWDSRVIDELVLEYAIQASELSRLIAIRSERDLLIALLAFVKDGAGGERFVASSRTVEQFAARFDKRITLGGTGVRAAYAMEAVGVSCTLHLVSIDDNVRRLLPRGSAYISSAERDTLDPHLIVQFVEGSRVRVGELELRSPHANRVIFANDPPNAELVLSDELGASLEQAELFMISGFNSMQSEELLLQRLGAMRRHLTQLPADALVFYEDSGFHVPALSRHVREALLERIDVYSMNEDEMQAYLGRSLDLLDVDEMAVALGELHELIPASLLVVHTKFWSLALGARADDYEDALRGAIQMASTRYVRGDGFTERNYDQTGLLPVNPLGADFARGIRSRRGTEVCCVPAFLLTVARPTTIGLGDTFVGGFIAAIARRA